jgi:hypothetical protein
MPQVHPRSRQTERAKGEVETWTLAWLERHDLTWLEGVWILVGVAERWTTLALRQERHPDSTERKAGDANE